MPKQIRGFMPNAGPRGHIAVDNNGVSVDKSFEGEHLLLQIVQQECYAVESENSAEGKGVFISFRPAHWI